MRRSRSFSVPLRALTLAGLLLVQTPVWGQSFLEKLEQAVKNQLAESTSNEPPAAEASPTNQEELPAPTNPSTRSQPDGNQPAVSSGEVPVPAPAPALCLSRPSRGAPCDAQAPSRPLTLSPQS